ncbi:MAG: acetyl-CoA carboxylase carboxyl transferase subunit beta, partial [Weissella confusa]
MDLFNNTTVSTPKIKRDANLNDRIPDGLFLACPYCGAQLYSKQLGDHRVCPNCGYGFRLQARERMALMTNDFEELDADLKLADSDFPGYAAKLER